MVAVRPLEPGEVREVDRRLPLSRLRRPVGDGSTYLIAWDGDQPIGHAHIAWCGTHLGLPEIQDVFVLREQRRRGVATELSRASEDAARERGWERISVSPGTRIVIYSGDEASLRRANEAGFRDTLLKGAIADDLLALVGG